MGKLVIGYSVEKKTKKSYNCIISLKTSIKNNMDILSTTLVWIFLLPLAVSSPISGGSSGSCYLKHSGINDLFKRKHVGTNYAGYNMTENAMHHSCERNRKEVNNKRFQTGVNGVLFGPVSAGYDPASVNKCSKIYTDLYQCTGVPNSYAKKEKENFSACKSRWTTGQGWKSCKKTYTDAQRFYVEADQNSGHFEYTKVQYEDSSGIRHTFNTNTCTNW